MHAKTPRPSNPTVPNVTKLILVEDHPIFREGLLRVISRDARFTVVAEAEDGEAGEKLIREFNPDIAVLDGNLPRLDGLELAQRLHQSKCSTRIVMLTMHKSEELFHKAIEAHVAGYVLKENAAPEILQCLAGVARGETYISPVLSNLMVRRINAVQRLHQEQPLLNELTRMERNILKLLANNKSTKEIASELFISPHTVQTHRKNISRKLQLSGAHGLIQFALEHRAEL